MNITAELIEAAENTDRGLTDRALAEKLLSMRTGDPEGDLALVEAAGRITHTWMSPEDRLEEANVRLGYAIKAHERTEQLYKDALAAREKAAVACR